MEDAAAPESNNMDESLRLESHLVQEVREVDVERTNLDLLQERLEQMHPEDVKKRIQLFQKLFNSCVTNFEEGEETFNNSHELSSARPSLENYVMFKVLVTKLQDDDAIMAIAPSLSHKLLFTEFKSVRYSMRMTWESPLANMIASIWLRRTKVNLETLRLANAPNESENLETAKRLFQEQLEQVRPATLEFGCTFEDAYAWYGLQPPPWPPPIKVIKWAYFGYLDTYVSGVWLGLDLKNGHYAGKRCT